jgi:hypothetical protein
MQHAEAEDLLALQAVVVLVLQAVVVLVLQAVALVALMWQVELQQAVSAVETRSLSVCRTFGDAA